LLNVVAASRFLRRWLLAMPQGCGASVTTVGEACSNSSSSSRGAQHDSLHAQGSSAGHAASHQNCTHWQPQQQQQQQQQARACALQQQQHRQQHHHRRSSSCRSAWPALPRQLLLAALIALSAPPLPAWLPRLPGPQLASATEINSAVSIFGPWDYELREDGGSRCTDMVQRTAELGLNTRTMFLPTLFWVSKHEDGFFEHTKVRTPHSRTLQGSAPRSPVGTPEFFNLPVLPPEQSGLQRHHINRHAAHVLALSGGHQPAHDPHFRQCSLGRLQVDAEEYFDDQREVEYFCFNQQYHRAPKQVLVDEMVCLKVTQPGHVCQVSSMASCVQASASWLGRLARLQVDGTAAQPSPASLLTTSLFCKK
jgi:hypothetical protein